jgi:RND family efflux transporter MFP subunit
MQRQAAYRSRSFLVIAVVALSIPSCVGLAGCGKKPAAEAKDGNGNGSGTVVAVQPAEAGSITKSSEVTGALVALNDVVVGARLAGKVASVNVREGDSVTAGQVVAVMDMADYRAQFESAQANLEAALTRRAQAAAQADQAANMLKQAETNLSLTERSTGAGLAVAQAALASAEQSLAVLRQGARPQERQQAEQQVRAAKANLTKAQSDLKRMEALAKDQAIAANQLDQIRAAHEAAEAAYRTAAETLSLVQEGPRKEDIRRGELAVDQAREGLKKAEADRDLVEVRKADVANARLALQSAKSGVSAAEQAVRQARAAVALAMNNLSGAQVRAPISGVVAARLAEPGQQLGAGGPILRIVAPGSVYFQASVSETQYDELRIGQPVSVTVDAIPGLTLAGRVSRILPVASSAARSFTVRVDLTSGDPRLRPQMFARGRVTVGVHTNVVLVNKDAVIFGARDDGGTVFVVDAASKAHARRVRIGYMDASRVEVLSGIKPGENVVAAGQNVLQDGDPVTVQDGLTRPQEAQ